MSTGNKGTVQVWEPIIGLAVHDETHPRKIQSADSKQLLEGQWG